MLLWVCIKHILWNIRVSKGGIGMNQMIRHVVSATPSCFSIKQHCRQIIVRGHDKLFKKLLLLFGNSL